MKRQPDGPDANHSGAAAQATLADRLFADAVREHRAGRLTEAERLCRQMLEVDLHHADGLHLLGVINGQAGRHDIAADMFGRAIALNPGVAGYHYALGVALQRLGRLDEATACYRRAIAIEPNHPPALNNLGIVLRLQSRLDEAVACLRAATDRNPNRAAAHNSLGLVFKEQGRLDDAIACFRTAAALEPAFAEAHSNLGTALAERAEPDEAADCYRRAIALDPDFAEAHNNLGTALMAQGQSDAAAACYRRAVALMPDYADAHCNLAMVLLASGDLPAGWQENEWRRKTPHAIRTRRDFTQPQWHGEPAAGRTLLVHAEQGFGDTLQFCRYAPLAAERGLRVILEVQAPLVRLLRTLPGVDRVVAQRSPLPAFDLHCPMLSMPLAMGTTLATIPGAVPYLHADPAQVAAWRSRLAAAGKAGPRVGVAWAGNPRNHLPAAAATDRRRSIAPDRLLPLLSLPGLQFSSLQKDGPVAPAQAGLIDVMPEMADFADTAALVANLDLVVSVDTAVAHLAAALGRPVWMLDRFDPDWRWLTGRRDSPWYSTLRIYRQPRPDDWDAVLAAVVSDLQGVVQGRLNPLW